MIPAIGLISLGDMVVADDAEGILRRHKIRQEAHTMQATLNRFVRRAVAEEGDNNAGDRGTGVRELPLTEEFY